MVSTCIIHDWADIQKLICLLLCACVCVYVCMCVYMYITFHHAAYRRHSHFFEHDLASPDGGAETIINNHSVPTIESSPLRPTYSDFNTPDPTVVARMSTFNPDGDVIPTLIRSYSSNSLSRNRIHTTIVENHGARELTDDELEHEKFPTP